MLEPSHSKGKLLLEPLQATSKHLTTFGSGIGLILIASYLIGLYRFGDLSRHLYFLPLAVFFITCGLFLHPVIKPIFTAWMFIAVRIGHVVTLTILFILFAFVVTPLGILRRRFKNQDISLTFSPDASSSYWIERAKVVDKSRYLKEF